MKRQHYIIASAFALLIAQNGLGQTNSFVVDFSKDAGLYNPKQSPLDKTNNDGSLGFSWLAGRPDLTIMVEKPEACPPQYSLSISNTNLFSAAERAFLREIWSKCRLASTNVLNSARTKVGDGYDAGFGLPFDSVKYKANPKLRGEDYNSKVVAITNHNDCQLKVEQVKHWQLDGLRVEFYGDHGGCLLRFANDKAVGEWFDWDPLGNLRFQAKFNKPYPLFEHLVMFK